MNAGSYLRTETILAMAARAGRRVAMVTAKEKLRDILSHNLHGIAFSAEKANCATTRVHGIEKVEALVGLPTPDIYSADASVFVLAAGVALVQHGLADFLYLSLTDYMQHKYAPNQVESLEFYEQLDYQLGELIGSEVLLGITADHGMNSKQHLNGTPNVIYLETELSSRFGEGLRCGASHYRSVRCPSRSTWIIRGGSRA